MEHRRGNNLGLLKNAKYVEDLRGESSSRELGEKWGVAYSTINVHRKRINASKPSRARKTEVLSAPTGEFEVHRPDGSSDYSRFSSEPWGHDDYREFIRSRGQDPDEVSFSWGWTSNPSGGFWNKLLNVRPKKGSSSSVDISVIEEAIRGHKPAPRVQGVGGTGRTLVVVPTDLQVGKTDWLGGTPETYASAINSFHNAVEIARQHQVDEILIIDAGDIIENEYNTSSQLATNDTSLPWQVVGAMRIMLEGIKLLAPHAKSVKYAAVSSNHGSHRKGMKAPAADVHSDYGLAIASILGESLKLNPEAFGHVEVILPEPYMESLLVESSGSRIGVVHGHQVNSPDRLGDWWKGQSHGKMPTSDARILVAGHWHSLRVQQSGDSRWVFVGPSSDRGSSWFTNIKGESSETGMLSFITSDNKWSDLTIL